MSTFTYMQTALNGGEFAPALSGRVDQDRYALGAEKLLNYIVHPEGGVSNRPGTNYVGTLPGPGRLIPFDFGLTQTYVLAFTDAAMRVVKDGGFVQSGGGDYVEVSPFSVDDLTALDYVQSTDTLFFAHPSYEPRKVVRADHDDWTFSTLGFQSEADTPILLYGSHSSAPGRDISYKVASVTEDGEVSIPSESVVVDTSSPWSSGAVTTLKWNPLVLGTGNPYQWTQSTNDSNSYYLEANGGGDPSFTEPDVLYENEVEMEAGTIGALAVSEWAYGDIDSLGYDTVYVRTAGTTDPDAEADYYIQYKKGQEFNVYKNRVGFYGLMRIVPNPWAKDDFISESIDVTPQIAKDPFNAADDYPGAVSIFQQRLVFARTNNKPNTIWLSQTGNLKNFNISSPLQSTDSISKTNASLKVNEIKYMVPADKLFLFSSEGEMSFENVGGGAVTPGPETIIDTRSQNGSAAVKPVVANDTILYLQKDKKTIRDLFSQSEETELLGIGGRDLTIWASHIFEGKTVVSMAYQRAPYRVLWAVLSDGTIATLTYVREHSVWAWSTQETDGNFKDVAVINTTGGKDQVYFIVEREIDGSTVYYIEKLADRGVTEDDAVYLDSSLTYTGAATSTLSGLDHLEGETLSALANGHVYNDLTVSGGSVTLPRAETPIHIGLPMPDPTIKTLRPDAASASGGTIQGKRQSIKDVILRVKDTRGGWIGPAGDETLLTEIKTLSRSSEDYGESVTLKQGDVRTTILSRMDRTGQLIIKQKDPLPMTILAIISVIEVGDEPGGTAR